MAFSTSTASNHFVGIDEFIFIKEPLMFSVGALSYESFGRCWVDAVIPDVSSR